MEIEAKFAIPDAAVFHALQAPTRLGLFSLTNAHIRHVHDTYLDTPDRRLYRAGYGFRQREQEGGWLMTLKQLGGVEGALRRREELELALPEACPPAAWPPSPLRSRVLELLGDQGVQPIFALDQTRIVRNVTAQERDIVELSLDEVHLTAPDRAELFFTLEAELLPAGTEAELHALMALLQSEWALEPERESKLARAAAFFGLDMSDPTP
jgi:inorganic triphosphatase YgiF